MTSSARSQDVIGHLSVSPVRTLSMPPGREKTLVLTFQFLRMENFACLHIPQYHNRQSLGGEPTDSHDALSGEVDFYAIRVSHRRKDVSPRELLEGRAQN